MAQPSINPSLILGETSPADSSIRCKVYEVIIRTKSAPNLKLQSSSVSPSSFKDVVTALTQDPEAKHRIPKKYKKAKTVILGPHPPMRLEVSNSSDDSSPSPSSSNLQRSASTSDLPGHVTDEMVSENVTIAPSSPSQLAPTPPRPQVRNRHRSKSNPLKVVNDVFSSASDQMDWNEYSRPLSDMDVHGYGGSSNTPESWSRPSVDEGPAVLINDAQPATRKIVSQDVLADLLHKCVISPEGNSTPKLQTPPPQTPMHRHASRRPRLSTISSDSPPPSPTEQMKARKARAQLKTDKRSNEPDRHPTAMEQMRMRKAEMPPVKSPPVLVKNSPRELMDTESEASIPGAGCAGCGRKKKLGKWHEVEPCWHILCSACFSSSLAAVSVTHGSSKCPACLEEFHSFNTFQTFPNNRSSRTLFGDPIHSEGDHHNQSACGSVTLRIDNVAWDITPQAVIEFLPPGTLDPEHPLPVHILLDRYDGRTKDYMYVEAASLAAAKRVLKRRQNTLMTGGRPQSLRKRPVTITQVAHSELMHELRPKSPQELAALLALCQAAVSRPPADPVGLGNSMPFASPNDIAYYVKSRHGPFHALMSIMTKLKGRDSPAYWDVFRTASGAIAALATSSFTALNSTQYVPRPHPEDEAVLLKLRNLYQRCFGMDEIEI